MVIKVGEAVERIIVEREEVVVIEKEDNDVVEEFDVVDKLWEVV